MALVILNFKAYKEAIGENAVKLAETAKEVKEQTGVRIIVAPQATDIFRTSPVIETIAQHFDPIEAGAGTGYLLANSIAENGATGSILNHSEHKLAHEKVETAIAKLRELGLKSIVCAGGVEEAKKLSELNPDYLAIEPPELIGTGISVSAAQPELIKNSVSEIKKINKNIAVLCGAGISNGIDSKKAKELGAEGVLLASAFTKAKNPKKVLLDIAEGLK